MDTFEGDDESPLSLHKYLYAQANPIDNTDPGGNQIVDVIGAIAVNMTIQAMPTVLKEVVDIVKHILPYQVVVVTPSSGAPYEPQSKVKNSAQARIAGWPVGTPIRIAVPPGINPQTMVDQWSSRSAWNPRTWLEFKRTWSDPANNYKTISAIFDAYGNFEFGATGAAAGFSLLTLQAAADVLHGGTNDPVNQADISSGYAAINKGGKLSTAAEKLAP
jgi:Bacterial toxin 44